MTKPESLLLLRRLFSTINNHLITLFLLGMIIVTSLILLPLSAVLEVSKPAAWWFGWILIEISRVVVFVILLTRFFDVRLRQDTIQYRLFQRLFLRRLAHQETARLRQHILDQMMLENLLERADLSGTQLAEVHLEGANLKQSRLWRADLSGADLESANLQDAWLGQAILRYAKLTSANLRSADLEGCNLERANLANANLSAARLVNAHLQGASLYDTELAQAILDHADLSGSNLRYANFRGASLVGTRFDNSTVLPDGTNWTPDTDMSRFTDARHPHFVAFEGPDATLFKERNQRLA